MKNTIITSVATAVGLIAGYIGIKLVDKVHEKMRPAKFDDEFLQKIDEMSKPKEENV